MIQSDLHAERIKTKTKTKKKLKFKQGMDKKCVSTVYHEARSVM